MSTRLYLALLASPRLRTLARVSCSMSTLARVPHSHVAAALLPLWALAGTGLDGSTGSRYGSSIAISMRCNNLASNQTQEKRQP